MFVDLRPHRWHTRRPVSRMLWWILQPETSSAARASAFLERSSDGEELQVSRALPDVNG